VSILNLLAHARATKVRFHASWDVKQHGNGEATHAS